MKRRLNIFKTIFLFRLLSILDVLFAEKFELTTYRNGKQKSTTKFSKKEIKQNIN